MTTSISRLELSSRVGVALDMHGCPNRCRHCFMGRRHSGKMTEDDLRWAAGQFREFKNSATGQPLWPEINVMSWAYEPDYSPNYRRLYEVENELSTLPSLRPRHELLSAWRVARDPEYAPWAYSIGLQACQLTFFGLEEATDWGCRRKGAFKDLLIATERLLAAGIRPRWQLMFTKRILPDLPGLIKLAEELRLRERCEALDGEFRFFMHSAAPSGEGKYLESLRPTLEDLALVPEWLRDPSETKSESELLPELMRDEQPAAKSIKDFSGPSLFFLIAPNFDVYPNAEGMCAPWRLGNLTQDGLATIADNLVNCRTPGLQALFQAPVAELASHFGRPDSRRIYHPADLKGRWVNIWADEAINANLSWAEDS